jgi:hypothetical protein
VLKVIKAEADAKNAMLRALEQLRQAREAQRKAAQGKRTEAAKQLGPPPLKGIDYADESTDFHVKPPFGKDGLPTTQPSLHSPTPTTIPGATVLTTYQMYHAIADATLGSTLFIVDVWSDPHPNSIPAAYPLPNAGLGVLDAKAANQLWQALFKLTGGNFDAPIIFFSHDVKDWEGYNAAIRATQMSYDKVYWYRGGLAAWQAGHQKLYKLK